MKIKVKDTYKSDYGRGIVRISTNVFEELKLNPGDVVLIEGKKKAVGLAWMSDEEEGIARMDGILRHNAGVSIDDTVEINKVDNTPAKELKLAPNQEIRFGQGFVAYVHDRILNMPFLNGNVVVIEIMGNALPLTVTNVKPKGIVRVVPETKIIVSEKPQPVSEGYTAVSYEDIGGLKDEIERVRETIEVPMKHPEVFKKLGITPPKGVLLYGPPGTGKTLLAKAVANETDSNFAVINGPELMSKYYGQSEENLRRVFEEAKQNAPSIVFIDEIDSLAPKRGEVTGDVEKRIVSQLLTLMDGLDPRGDVVVIAATNRPEDIDEALRRPGRFDREIEIRMPDKNGRKEILQIHTRSMPLENVDLDHNADITHGYSGADLAALCREAGMTALRRIVPDLKKSDEILSKEVIENLKITDEDFYNAYKRVEPSAMREVLIEVPKVKWADIGGLDDVEQELKETVEWPLTFPELFEDAGIEPLRGILLYGPPGCGKTLLAKAIANESNANFISVKGPELLSKWVGESEKGVRKVFSRARQAAPSIIFFDEIDSLAGVRGSDTSRVTERVVAQILSELDGISSLKDVIVVGATNRPDLIDKALLRPGRFERMIFIPMPSKETRKEIFKVHTKKMKLKDVDIGLLVEKTSEYSGADITALCREAGMNELRRAVKEGKKKIEGITMEDFTSALKKVKPSVDEEQRKQWEDMKEGFSRYSIYG
ncbi:MAG: CDC48 family AAA ATPase [Methanomicrobia archaeon]|nr:CDC48 family AAA ATPase [Methanomicrobia archaeon]